MFEDASKTVAKMAFRGGPAHDDAPHKGAFYRPTLLEVTDSSIKIVQEEIFGPVLTMQVFDTEEDAVTFANDSERSCSSVWSRDIDRPLRVVSAIEAGTVWINN